MKNPFKKGELQKRRFTKRDSLTVAALFFFILFTVIYIRGHQVAGISMEPTMQTADRYLIFRTKQVARYDLITFQDKDTSIKEQYVKRVMGIPGDHLWVTKTNIFIRPEEAREIYPHEADSVGLWDSTLALQATEEILKQMEGLTKIPEGYYFVLGDNRQESKDSRSMGLISEKDIEGKAFYRYYPLNRIGFLN